MTRSSRVFVPPADHIFRISWDLSRDTTHSVQENMKTYMSTESPLLPRRPEITNLCQWSIGLARGIMEVLLHIRPHQQLQRWLIPPLYKRLVTIVERDRRLSKRSMPSRAVAY